ncbi:MAG: DoxX family protein [Deltaproteobacteria bacterium]
MNSKAAHLPHVSAPPLPRARLWAGRVLSGFVTLFLTMDLVMKLIGSEEALKGTAELGWPTHVVFALGLVQLACLVLYLVPRTALLGAVLWTGYLGGAIATHVRVENPLFSHVLFPIYVAAFLWGGLYLRDPRVRAMLAPRRQAED